MGQGQRRYSVDAHDELAVLLDALDVALRSLELPVDHAYAVALMVFLLVLTQEDRALKIVGCHQDEVRHFDNVIIPVLLIVGGLAALIGGGKMFVNHACSIAQRLGWSEKFIAITILAGGTSLPELATCIAAAIKKKGQLALGNILGSNISNICLILGGSALIHPLSMENITITDMGFLLLASLFLLVADFTYDRRKLDRAEGVALVLFECIYMFLLIKAL